MVLFVMICRASDGLPLLASTDVDERVDYLRDSQRYVKLLSKRVAQFPDRCLVQTDSFSIFFITALDVSFIAVCDSSYPAVLSYCFLDEIQKEFILQYDVRKVEIASRPYSFIDFDSHLRKTKQRYNNPRSLTTKLNLSDMSHELRLRRPYEISITELEHSMNGSFGASNASRFKPAEVPGKRTGPLSCAGWLSVVLNLSCVILNVMEGMKVVNDAHIGDDLSDFGSLYDQGAAFLVTCCLLLYQLYLLRYSCRWKKTKAYSTMVAISVLTLYTRGWRHIYEFIFIVGTSIFTTFSILAKVVCYKSSDYDV